jgi:hypothetical protein
VSARALTDPVQAWRDGGELVEVGGRRLFVAAIIVRVT